MRIEETKRLYLHVEINQPDTYGQKFHGREKITDIVRLTHSTPALSTACLAVERAVRDFKGGQLSNDDFSAIDQDQISFNEQADQAAFRASQKAVEGFKFGELVLPL